jgi:hypothetical protein
LDRKLFYHPITDVGQETAYTTAHLSSEIDASYRKILQLHGEKGAQLAAESHTAAISEIESVITREKIDCVFERLDGYLLLTHGDSEKTLVEEFEATQRVRLDVMRCAWIVRQLI